MTILPQTMLQIVSAGGGLIIDLSKNLVLPETLVQLASAASQSGAKITIKGITTMLPATMVQIAAAGRGAVTFEI